MRCPICLAKDALDFLDDKKVDGKKITVHICTCCDATGTKKELEMQSLEIIDDRWAYFFWPKYSLGLFFRNSYWPQNPRKFSAKMYVSTPSLAEIGTEIHFTGIGEQGLTNLMLKELRTKTLFPVNLFEKSRILDPKPSRTVTKEMMEEWKQIVPVVLTVSTLGSNP